MSHTILMIDDDVSLSDNISSILELDQYKVVTVDNGEAGVELAQKIHPDLILCDIMLTGMNGHQVLKFVRGNPAIAAIPFIFMTGLATTEDFRNGMGLGADDYLIKPFSSAELLKTVALRLKKAETQKATTGYLTKDVHSFFNSAKEIREFRALTENRTTRTFKKKELVFMEGQMPTDLHYIKKGEIKTYKLSDDGKELITGIHAEGDFLGFVPLLEGIAYNENAEVLSDCVVALIPKPDFIALVYSSNDIAKKFLTMLSQHIEDMENRLLDLAYQSVRQRAASALLKIEESFSNKGSDHIITLTRRDISNMVGVATESLNRTLADFRDESLIEISDSGLRIIDHAKLRKLTRQ